MATTARCFGQQKRPWQVRGRAKAGEGSSAAASQRTATHAKSCAPNRVPAPTYVLPKQSRRPYPPHAPECTGKLLKQLALSFVDCRVSDQLALGYVLSEPFKARYLIASHHATSGTSFLTEERRVATRCHFDKPFRSLQNPIWKGR